MKKIISNEYLLPYHIEYLKTRLKIDEGEEFKIWSTCDYLYNNDEYKKIYNFQITKIYINKEIIKVESNPKISIIIICSENTYLEKTVNSIQNQNFNYFEIIVVYDNDDQTDYNLILNYIKKYPNIKLINNNEKKGYVYSISIYSYADLTSGGDDTGTADPGTDDPGTDTPDEDITVNPDGSKTASFDFSALSNQTSITSVTTSDDAITMTSTKASGGTDTTYYNDPNSSAAASLRIYKGTTIAFNASGSNKILKVEFTSFIANASKTKLVDSTNLTVTNGSYTVDSDNKVTISANGEGVSSLSFVYTGEKHIAITSISITYK